MLAWRLRPAGKFPQLIDFYLLRNFVFYFGMLLVGFLVLFEAFNFFELLDDIAQHRVPMIDVLTFFLYLAFYLFYQLAPLACVVAVLVTLGIMAKNNELIALKAAGVSLYRVALPLIVVGLCLASGLVMLDDTYLPYAIQRQDALRNQIQGRPAQTFYQPQRSWILGDDSTIFNYQLFDADRSLFGRLNIFELDPQTFAMRRRIYAERAHWVPESRAWALSSGWVRNFSGNGVASYTPFTEQTFSEIHEPPSYFIHEVRQGQQMSWQELRRYIDGLARAGFDVARLSVRVTAQAGLPADRSDCHVAGGSLFAGRGKPGRGRGPVGRGRNCRCLLGLGGPSRGLGRRRPVAAGHGGMDARRRILLCGAVLLPQDADVAPSRILRPSRQS